MYLFSGVPSRGRACYSSKPHLHKSKFTLIQDVFVCFVVFFFFKHFQTGFQLEYNYSFWNTVQQLQLVSKIPHSVDEIEKYVLWAIDSEGSI